MKNLNFEPIIFVVMLTIHLLSAARTPGATFLLIPPTAKATGMAYAWTAIANDASANYYNGAGLGFLESPCLTFSYFKYLPGLHSNMQYIYFAGAYPLANSGWGFDFVYFSPGAYDIIDQEGHYLGARIVWRVSPKITYSKRINENLSLAFGFKIIYQKYSCYSHYIPSYGFDPGGSGKTIAFDFNLLWKILKNLSFGAIFHNLGPAISYAELSSEDPLPCLFRMGITYKWVEFDNLSITTSAEITKILVDMFTDENATFFENLRYEIKEAWKGIGAEVQIYESVIFRIGYFYDYEGRREGIAFGGGVKIKGLEFDIGVDEKLFDFQTQNRKISLSYTF